MRTSSFNKIIQKGQQNSISLCDAPTIAIDASRGNLFFVTIHGNRKISVLRNSKDGQVITLKIYQDAVGGRSISWDPLVFRGSNDEPLPIIATVPDTLTNATFIFNADAGKWDYLGKLSGFI